MLSLMLPPASLKRTLIVVVVASAAFMARPTSAEDAYQVGVTGALKGRSAASYAPVVEALRLYIDRVNAAGGVNGKPVNLLIEDDLTLPWKAGANARKFLTEDKAVLMLSASLSMTYASVVTEAKSAGVPLIFAGSVCPKDVYPPAAEDAFCTTAFAATYDSRAALSFVHEAAAEPVKIAFVAMAIPLSRREIDFAAGEAPRLGMTVVYKEGILPPTEDYTPFANGIKDAGANWVYSWAPWVTQIRTYEALRQIGWSGSYITWAHTEAEAELERIKDPNLYVIGANALFADALPIQKEVVTAMNEAGSKYRPEQMTEGWIAGMTVEAALKAAGADATPAKVRAALQNLKVDVQGLRGGPIEWTRENHFRLKQYYRVYHWDGARITPVKDWFAYEVK
jgi:ABC-type branched-subunit amino acid transport system substrate-binding protein